MEWGLAIVLSCFIFALWVVKKLTHEETWYRRMLNALWRGFKKVVSGIIGLFLWLLLFSWWRFRDGDGDG